jgi:hypothetical protein
MQPSTSYSSAAYIPAGSVAEQILGRNLFAGLKSLRLSFAEDNPCRCEPEMIVECSSGRQLLRSKFSTGSWNKKTLQTSDREPIPYGVWFAAPLQDS